MHVSSKQRHKAEMWALHEHTLYLNSEQWERLLERNLTDGISSRAMEVLGVEPDTFLDDTNRQAMIMFKGRLVVACFL